MLPLCVLWKRANFVKLYVRATNHKLNTYEEYFTRCDNCALFPVDHQEVNVSRATYCRIFISALFREMMIRNMRLSAILDLVDMHDTSQLGSRNFIFFMNQ